MEDPTAHVSVNCHVWPHTAIEADTRHMGDDDGIAYVTIDIGGPSAQVVLFLSERDDLRRLADVAAKAYHDWTRAKHLTAPLSAAPVNGPLADPTGIDCAEAYEGVEP